MEPRVISIELVAFARIRRVALAIAVATSSCYANAASAQDAAGKCQLVRVAEWPVRIVRGKIVVDGTANGRKIAIEIDTGSTRTIMLRSAAARLGLEERDIRGQKMFGIGGETHVGLANVGEFTIGDAALKDMHFLVAGEQAVGSAADVILGEDFLSKVDVEFDLAHDAVRLFQPKDCEGVSLAYWASDGGGSIAIEEFSPAQPEIVVSVEINGVAVDAMLDSGAFASMLNMSDAQRVGVTPDTQGVRAAGNVYGLGAKPVPMWVGTFETVVVGNERIRDARLAFADLQHDTRYAVTGSNTMRSRMKPMLLGADFIRAHRLLVSHSKRRVYFTYVGGPAFDVQRAGEPPAAIDANRPPKQQVLPPRLRKK